MKLTNRMFGVNIEYDYGPTSYSETIKKSKIMRYKRNIDIYVNLKKDDENIVGNDVVKHISCVVTNYSVSELKNKQIMVLRTYYIATLDTGNYNLGNITMDMIPAILDIATFKPDYGFMTNHVTDINNPNNYVDYGLTLLDFGSDLNNGMCSIVNFSDQNDKIKSKSIIDESGACITPKFYTAIHRRLSNEPLTAHSDYKYELKELIDDKTELNIVPFKFDCTYTKRISKRRYKYNSKIQVTSEFFELVFVQLLLNCVDNIEFKYDNISKTIKFANIRYFDDLFNMEKIRNDMVHINNELMKICSTFDFKDSIDCIFYYSDRNRDKIKIVYSNGDILDYETSKYNALHRYMLNREDYDSEIENKKDVIESDILTQFLAFNSPNNMSNQNMLGYMNYIEDTSKNFQMMKMLEDFNKLN